MIAWAGLPCGADAATVRVVKLVEANPVDADAHSTLRYPGTHIRYVNVDDDWFGAFHDGKVTGRDLPDLGRRDIGDQGERTEPSHAG